MQAEKELERASKSGNEMSRASLLAHPILSETRRPRMRRTTEIQEAKHFEE